MFIMFMFLQGKSINVHSKRSRRIYCEQHTKSSFNFLWLVITVFRNVLFFPISPPTYIAIRKKDKTNEKSNQGLTYLFLLDRSSYSLHIVHSVG